MVKIRLFVSTVIFFLVFYTESKSIDFKAILQLCVIVYLWTSRSPDNVIEWLNSCVWFLILFQALVSEFICICIHAHNFIVMLYVEASFLIQEKGSIF